jgi:hypothetical protein
VRGPAVASANGQGKTRNRGDYLAPPQKRLIWPRTQGAATGEVVKEAGGLGGLARVLRLSRPARTTRAASYSKFQTKPWAILFWYLENLIFETIEFRNVHYSLLPGPSN